MARGSDQDDASAGCPTGIQLTLQDRAMAVTEVSRFTITDMERFMDAITGVYAATGQTTVTSLIFTRRHLRDLFGIEEERLADMLDALPLPANRHERRVIAAGHTPRSENNGGRSHVWAQNGSGYYDGRAHRHSARKQGFVFRHPRKT